jgi:hypothetical protein
MWRIYSNPDPHGPKNRKLSINQSIFTPIKVQKLTEYLAGYDVDLTRFLIQGFSEGFKIPFYGNGSFRLAKNLSF